MTAFSRAPFLASCAVIDVDADAVRERAARITAGVSGPDAICALFTWVRDSIAHTGDAGHGKVTLRASDVLRERTGLCYAKSHLLVALLRAANIPAGLCYQRLACDDAASCFVLHGLVAVMMPDRSFHRIDPRGNKPGIAAQFAPGRELLAFAPALPGEADLPGVFARPLPEVVAALSVADSWHPSDTRLPDVKPEHWPAADAPWQAPAVFSARQERR
jgi:transglutaminase-like putative cysteine protease